MKRARKREYCRRWMSEKRIKSKIDADTRELIGDTSENETSEDVMTKLSITQMLNMTTVMNMTTVLNMTTVMNMTQ